MHIFYVTDDNYKDYLLLTIQSILKSAKKNENLYFHILVTRILNNDDFENKLRKLKQIKFCKMEVIYLSDHFIKDFPVKLHITNTAYLRYFIPILKPKLDKCLYLDIDTIVLQSLKPLYNINFKKW